MPMLEGFDEWFGYLVEALLVRDADAGGWTESPLAEHAGRVAGLLHDLGDGDVLKPQRNFGPPIAANPAVAGMHAGHQRAAGRSAYGASGISLREAQALLRDGVDVWRVNGFLAVTAEIGIAQIVRQYE